MANHKQAIKRHRQSLKRQDRNTYYKSTMRTYLKQARAALAEGNADDATPAVKKVISYLDHVAMRRVLPKGRVNRLKSRLTKQLAALG